MEEADSQLDEDDDDEDDDDDDDFVDSRKRAPPKRAPRFKPLFPKRPCRSVAAEGSRRAAQMAREAEEAEESEESEEPEEAQEEGPQDQRPAVGVRFMRLGFLLTVHSHSKNNPKKFYCTSQGKNAFKGLAANFHPPTASELQLADEGKNAPW